MKEVPDTPGVPAKAICRAIVTVADTLSEINRVWLVYIQGEGGTRTGDKRNVPSGLMSTTVHPRTVESSLIGSATSKNLMPAPQEMFAYRVSRSAAVPINASIVWRNDMREERRGGKLTYYRDGAVQSEIESTVGEGVLNRLEVGVRGAVCLDVTIVHGPYGQLSCRFHLDEMVKRVVYWWLMENSRRMSTSD